MRKKRGRKIRKYLLSVKNSVKNISAGVKNASDVKIKTLSLLTDSYIQYSNTRKGKRHHSRNNIFPQKRELSERYKLGLFQRNISGIFCVKSFI